MFPQFEAAPGAQPASGSSVSVSVIYDVVNALCSVFVPEVCLIKCVYLGGARLLNLVFYIAISRDARPPFILQVSLRAWDTRLRINGYE